MSRYYNNYTLPEGKPPVKLEKKPKKKPKDMDEYRKENRKKGVYDT